jgi:hypothetical protein
MRDRFAGVMQTIWSPAGDFLDHYFERVPVPPVEHNRGGNPVACSKTVLQEFKKLDR